MTLPLIVPLNDNAGDDFLRVVTGFPGFYVSSTGTIYHRGHRGRVDGTENKIFFVNIFEFKGDSFFSVCKNANRKKLMVKNVVFEEFISHIPPGWVVKHHDGDKQNNEVKNLYLEPRFTNEFWREELPSIFFSLKEKLGFFKTKRILNLTFMEALRLCLHV